MNYLAIEHMVSGCESCDGELPKFLNKLRVCLGTRYDGDHRRCLDISSKYLDDAVVLAAHFMREEDRHEIMGMLNLWWPSTLEIASPAGPLAPAAA